ncbi:MAG TPA: hypothetical protein VF950_00290 [Planctomycetota bacterium]
MARRGRDESEEEVTEDMAATEEEASPAGAEFVPEATHKPKSDVYSAMLILTFLVFLAGAIVAGREAWEHYDVQFYMFTKEGKAAQGGGTTEVNTTPAPPPEPAPK